MLAKLPRRTIRAVLRRHRGTCASIARDLGVHPVTISKWLAGQAVSARIAEAAQAKAQELLAREAEGA
jgi:IS30 family transposase